MKKFILLVVLLFSLYSVVGCNNNEVHKPQVEKTASTKDNVKEEQNPDLNNDICVETEKKDKIDNNAQDLLKDNSGQHISAFIPEGWDELASAEGDLNKDGIIDKAIIIEKSNKSELDSPRSLLIAFGNENNTYKLSIRADKAILLKNEGGVFGDPFQDIVIDRGSVLLKFFGGASIKWNRYFRFRFQDNGWYLIGFTEGSYEAIGDEMYYLENDYNLLTGDYDCISENLEDGKIKTIKDNIGKKQLLNLKDFVANEYYDLDREKQKTDLSNDISSFIPEGWEILKKYDELAIAEGDLNKDGITDKAFIIEKSNESDINSPRNLVIAFGNKDNTYNLSIKAEKAILVESEGGTFGDPYKDIVIDRGSLLLKFFGGSSRWHRYFRFRYQNNGWYLIGFTEGSYEEIDGDMYCLQDDYNLITGDYIGEKLEDGEVKTIKENIGMTQLLNLKDFDASEYMVQYQKVLVD
jgi:hypothetical protein